MKAKVAVILLVLMCLVLGCLLVVRHKQAVKESEAHLAHIYMLSNNVVATQSRLDEEKSVNGALTNNLSRRKAELDDLSSNLTTVSSNLVQAQAAAKAAAELAAVEMAKRDARINELQGQNDDMTKRMTDLTSSMDKLEKQINDTQKKLEVAEGDKTYLIKELKRLQAEKADLEKQFNDLSILRDQVQHLKEELSIARRLEWIRQGIYGVQTQKGGERLQNINKLSTNKAPAQSFELRSSDNPSQKPTNSVPAPSPAPDGAPK
ncbi:MAG: hypothetical protein JWN25_464 [Verrucomicrobiales bacterium]|nr:hypothetical protein [Verrucomicrobiales bacterium]